MTYDKLLVYIQLFYIKILFKRKRIIEKIIGQLNMESCSTSNREQINATMRMGVEQRREKDDKSRHLISKYKEFQEEREEAIKRRKVTKEII